MGITRSLQLLIVVFVAGACFVALYWQTPGLASQLLLNGGFEEGAPTPDYWQNYGGTLERVCYSAVARLLNMHLGAVHRHLRRVRLLHPGI